ncbi:glycoside hydrolase family 75 protein [Streptomyces sp. NPDC091377]|uniref:glycoside hydrolase family 75 protein n=1 Tax=Streptomyces sp. NPDC091377 TaxID=3365995 RepID=UPI0038073B54
MLKVLMAELSAGAGEFTPKARIAVVAVPRRRGRPGAGPNLDRPPPPVDTPDAHRPASGLQDQEERQIGLNNRQLRGGSPIVRVPPLPLSLVLASAALLAPTNSPVTAPEPAPPPSPRPATADAGTAAPADAGTTVPVAEGAAPPDDPGPALPDGERTAVPDDRPTAVPAAETAPVSADALLARVRDCLPVSRGRYRSDAWAPADIPVCGTRGAVFWKADMDIDCDGRAGRHCNARSDPSFSPQTSVRQSDGRALSAETLPFVVVPMPSRIWDHREHGARAGAVAAVVHRDRVRYAVVGDRGPRDLIGEASYAMAEALGIDPDPRTGGAASGVTYIVFKDSRATPVESPAAAVREGERLAREFLR